MRARKADGDGCTVTNGDMADTIGYITPDGPPMCKNARPVAGVR